METFHYEDGGIENNCDHPTTPTPHRQKQLQRKSSAENKIVDLLFKLQQILPRALNYLNRWIELVLINEFSDVHC